MISFHVSLCPSFDKNMLKIATIFYRIDKSIRLASKTNSIVHCENDEYE